MLPRTISFALIFGLASIASADSPPAIFQGFALPRETRNVTDLSDNERIKLSDLRRQIEDLQNALPLETRALSANYVNNWVLRAPAGWDAMRVLNSGIDISAYPDLSRKARYALVPSTTNLNAGSFTLGTDIKYYDTLSSVQQVLSDTTGFSLGLSIDDFGLSLGFQSKSMQSSNSSKATGYLIVSYFDSQSLETTSNALSPEAGAIRDQRVFLNLYGTHYISAMRLAAYCHVIYTFSCESDSVLSQFGTSAGLKVGVLNWNAGLSTSVNNALSSFSKTVHVSSSVRCAGHAGLGLPTTVVLDPAAVKQISDAYNSRIATDRSGLPVVAFQIKPYSELRLGAPLPPGTDRTIADTLSTLREISYDRNDAALLITFADIYGKQVPAVTAFITELNRQNDDIATALIDLYFYQDALHAKKLASLNTAWTKFAADPSPWSWPSSPASPKIKCAAGPTADSFTVSVRTGRVLASQLASSLVATQPMTVSTTHTCAAGQPPSQMSPIQEPNSKPLTLFGITADPMDPTASIITYAAECIPNDGVAWIEVRDGIGRSFVFPTTTALAGRRTDLISTEFVPMLPQQ